MLTEEYFRGAKAHKLLQRSDYEKLGEEGSLDIPLELRNFL
jgi:hypothetical protein